MHQQAIREITERLISTGNMDGTLENCPGMKERVARLIALLLCIFVGGAGIHRFYAGKIGTGVLYLFTGGLFGKKPDGKD